MTPRMMKRSTGWQDSGSRAIISTAERAQRLDKLRSQVPSVKTVVLRGVAVERRSPLT